MSAPFAPQRERYTVVHMFAGSGGCSSGFEEDGFETIAAIDNDADACADLNYNYRAALAGCPAVRGGDECTCPPVSESAGARPRLRGMYDYQKERPGLLTERGQFAVCEAMLDAQALARGNGLIPHEALSDKIVGERSDSFARLAVVDRLIELGYIARADNGGPETPRCAWIYRWIARSRT